MATPFPRRLRRSQRATAAPLERPAARRSVAQRGLDMQRRNSGYEFTLGLAFGESFHSMATTLFQSLDLPFDRQRQRFIEQWDRACTHILPLEERAGDGGNLYHVSNSLLLAHEDKRYQGAMIASLSIPWGDAKGDEDISIRDGRVFDLMPAVADRYLTRRDCQPLEVWKFSRQPMAVMAGRTLRVQAPAAFKLRWTANEWQEVHDTESTAMALEIEFVDILIAQEQRAPIRFTFYWLETGRWEGRDFQVSVASSAG